MSKISLVEEVLKHSDDEIMDFLADKARTIRMVCNSAVDELKPEFFYGVVSDLDIVMAILIALDRRNKNRNV